MAGIIVFCTLFTAFIGKDLIAEEQNKTLPLEYKGIITVWQVDSFEGGVGSRKNFLLKIAREYEKKYKGLFIMVMNYTANGVKENLDKGIYPDLISFGGGTEVKGFSEINIATSFGGGKVDGKTYAAAWCRGGYALIYNPNLTDGKDERIENLLVSQGEYNLPLVALIEEGVIANNIEVKKPMDAYIKFVSGKTPYMLGTQRDIMRLNTRGMDAGIIPLTQFNDLVQYAVVTSKEQIKRYYAEKFLEFLLSEKIQSKLCEIGMLSVEKVSKSENDKLNLMQKVEGFSTVSAFTLPEVLREVQTQSLLAAKGNAEALNKIKNIVV
jgi:ABC-type glycerol-3-phosphate transport system substrate-binding protein